MVTRPRHWAEELSVFVYDALVFERKASQAVVQSVGPGTRDEVACFRTMIWNIARLVMARLTSVGGRSSRIDCSRLWETTLVSRG